MVKLAENKVVDIDVMPGTDEDKLKAQADALRYVVVFLIVLNFHCMSLECLSS